MSDQKTPERNAAGKALFAVQFALLLHNSGREEEGNTHLIRAQEILMKLEEEIDNVRL